MDWAEIFSFLTITWSTIVETWQCLPLAVTPSAAISSLSRERKASSTLVVLVFLPASLTINLPSITLASTSVTKIVSEVAFANLAFVIVTLRASIRQKSYKVQTGGLQDTGIGWGQRSWGGSQGSGGKVLLLANCLIPLHVVVDHLDRLCHHQISRYSAFLKSCYFLFPCNWFLQTSFCSSCWLSWLDLSTAGFNWDTLPFVGSSTVTSNLMQ